MKTENVLLAVLGFLGAATVYSMDWNREQDARMTEMDKMNQQQIMLNKNQIKYNQKIQEYNSIRFRSLQPTFNSNYKSPKSESRNTK